VYSAHPCKDGEIVHADMPRHLRVVAHDAIVANDAIVRDMAVCHDQAVIPYNGLPPVFCCPVNGYKFPHGSIVTYFHSGLFTLEFQILWAGCYHGPWEYLTIAADFGALHDGHITPNPGSFTDLHILMNYREWINFNIGGQFGIRMNVSMWMDHVMLLVTG
jgi:hypothetical protein